MTMENYYIRLSSYNKVQFLTRLIKKMVNNVSISDLVGTIYAMASKLAQYLKVSPQTNYIYDKILNDHNRSIEPTVNQMAIMNDVVWFTELKSTEQFKLMLSLLEVSGPATVRYIYPLLVKQQVLTHDIDTTREEDKSPFSKQYPNVDAVLEKENKIFHDSTPENAKVIEFRSNWKIMMADYKKKVVQEKDRLEKKANSMLYSRKQENAAKDIKGGAKGKSKDNKKDKKSKSKSSKKSSSKTGEADKIIDRIQLLPIWIAKKLFNYFDDKTLKKLRNVNSYWDYVAQEVLKERKLRKQLIKLNEKALRSLDAEFITRKDAQIRKKWPKKKPYHILGRRVYKGDQRGAIIESLRPDFLNAQEVIESSIFSSTLKNVLPDLEDPPIDKFMTYPRIPATGELYKNAPCDELFEEELHKHEIDEKPRVERVYSLSIASFDLGLDIENTAVVEDW
ncbi:uncharacterized protein LOC109608747 isoform X4 [Aethina tumida]|nr:uncharacterized protein LOC109608747 isoform X4 [Aethina tumida]